MECRVPAPGPRPGVGGVCRVPATGPRPTGGRGLQGVLQLSFQPLGLRDKGWNVQGRLPEDLCQGSG